MENNVASQADNGQTALLFILLVLATAFCVFYIRKKVIGFISEEYGAVSSLKVRWVLTGPPARGKGNFKYLAEFEDASGNKKALYLASSVFGSVSVING
jgi:hypothetical protein